MADESDMTVRKNSDESGLAYEDWCVKCFLDVPHDTHVSSLTLAEVRGGAASDLPTSDATRGPEVIQTTAHRRYLAHIEAGKLRVWAEERADEGEVWSVDPEAGISLTPEGSERLRTLLGGGR